MGHSSDSSIWPNRQSESLDVHLLGVVDFDAALLLQKHLVYEISGRNDRFGTLLLCEHPPTITIGREGSRADVLASQHELTARNLDVRWLNRGGGAVVHGLGQLAAYPVLPLDRLHCGLAGYRRRMLDAVIAACRELRVPAYEVGVQPSGCRSRIRENSERPAEFSRILRHSSATGQAEASTPTTSTGVACRCGQFAFLGAAVKSWVSYHGLFVNVSSRLDLMRLVRSTAADSRITSLAAQRLRPTSMHSVRESLVRHIAAHFEYARFHVHTGHPLLKRERRKVYAYA